MRIRPLRRLCWSAMLVLVATLGCLSQSASAGDLVADLSFKEIRIESNFTGADIVLFGALEGEDVSEIDRDRVDIVVQVRGPLRSFTSRRKERVAGIWVNSAAREFDQVPGFLAIASNRPIQDALPRALLEQYDIGLDVLASRLGEEDGTGPDDPFAKAVIRIMTEERLYAENPEGVKFLGDTLFRTNVALPAKVPVGEFEANVFLFVDKKLVSRYFTPLTVRKSGFEEYVYGFAFNRPFLYGVTAVLLAVAAGLVASAMFRRD